MNKIRMEIKLSNGEDEHILKFDEDELEIMIAALHDYCSDDCEEEYQSHAMSGSLEYFYNCIRPDDDYITICD